MTRIGISAFVLVAATLGSTAIAKLPALSDEAKAKAAEAAAKTAWSDKVAGFQLCKAQDRVASTYYSDMKKAGKDVKPAVETPPCADPGPFVAPGAASAPVAAAPQAAPPAAAAASAAAPAKKS